MASAAVAGWVAVAAGAASTAAQMEQDRKTRSAAERFRKRREMLERANALQAQRVAMAEIQARQAAEDEKAAAETTKNQIAADRARGTAKVVAGEAGAFGLSYEALVNDFDRMQAEFESTIQGNLALQRQFANLNLQSLAINTDARLLNAQSLPVSRPNYANYAISGINLGLGIYSGMKGPSAPPKVKGR